MAKAPNYSKNILVIGAGIMGLMAAFRLRKADPDALITITDQNGFPPTKNASAMAGGMLAPYSEIEHLPPTLLPAALQGLQTWRDMAGSPSANFGFSQNGSLLTAHAQDSHMLERFKSHLDTHNISYETLDTAAIAEIEPALAGRYDRAILLKEEAHLDPQAVLTMLSDRLWPKITQSTNVQPDMEWDWIIDCRGYGAAEDDPDLRGVKGETLTVRNPEFALSRPVRLMHPRYPLYIIPRADHVFMIGATIIESADEQISVRSGLELMSALYALHPGFAEAEILEIRAGIRPAYPDNLPRIKINDTTNIISCNGLFRHGYLLAPVMADCVSDYITGQDNEYLTLFTGGLNDHHNQRQRKNSERAA